MKTYARIQDGGVAELFDTNGDIRQLFHSSLMWVDVSSQPAVGVGWRFDGKAFAPPVAIATAPFTGVTIADLQRQIALLSGQIEALARR